MWNVDWTGIFDDIIRGFKKIGSFIVFIAMFGAIVWGGLSIPLIASGKVAFSWWYLPCWLVLVCFIALAIGSTD